MSTRNRRTIIAVLFLAAVAASVYYAVPRMDRNLTHIGRRVTNFKNVPAQQEEYAFDIVQGNRLLASYINQDNRQMFHVIDMNTGARTPLPALDKAIKYDYPIDPEISPNGQWLLYNHFIFGSHTLYYEAVKIDGSKSVQFETKLEERLSPTVWSEDCSGLVSFSYATGQISQCTIANPVERPLAKLQKPLDKDYYEAGSVPGGYLLYRMPTPNTAQFMRIGKDGSQTILGSASLPQGRQCDWIRLSPDKRRLLWCAVYKVAPSKYAWLRTIQTWLHMQSGSFHSLYTSDLNGSNLREVGYVPDSTTQTNSATSQFGVPQRGSIRAGWMQNGNQIWFESNNAIWVAPAN